MIAVARAGSRGVRSVQWHRAPRFRGPAFSVYTIITYKLIMNSDQLQDITFKVYTALESQKKKRHRQADILEAAILHSKPRPINFAVNFFLVSMHM